MYTQAHNYSKKRTYTCDIVYIQLLKTWKWSNIILDNVLIAEPHNKFRHCDSEEGCLSYEIFSRIVIAVQKSGIECWCYDTWTNVHLKHSHPNYA